MFKSNFFDSTKQLKEMLLLIEIDKDTYVSQNKLASILDISPGMVSRYIGELCSKELITIKRTSQKNYEHNITLKGISYKNELMKQYINDIIQFQETFKTQIDFFQKEYKLKIAITNSLGTLIPYISERLGYFKRGQMKIDLYEYENGEKLMEDFEQKKFDMALLGSVPAYLWKTYGCPIKVIASIDSGGHVILTKKDAGIENIGDLKGKKIIIPTQTTVTNNIFRIFIKQNMNLNLDYDNDLTIVNTNIYEIEKKFLNEDVDAVVVWEPHASNLLWKYDNLQVLYDFSNCNNSYIANVIIANMDFAKNYDNTVNKFIDILRETLDYYMNNNDAVDKLLSEKVDLSSQIIANARKRMTFKLNRLI